MLRPALVIVLGLAALKPSLCSKVASEAGSHVDDVPTPRPKLDDTNAKPRDEPSKLAEPKADDEGGGEAAAMEAAQALTGGDDEADKCVKDCVQRNQMRAVSAEMIEQDCKAECKAE